MSDSTPKTGFNYTVFYGGGIGPDVWDNCKTISAVDIHDAVSQARSVEEDGAWIFGIEQDDHPEDIRGKLQKTEEENRTLRSKLEENAVSINLLADASAAIRVENQALAAENKLYRDGSKGRFVIDQKCLTALESVGMGAEGKPNTLVAMVLEAVAELSALRAENSDLKRKLEEAEKLNKILKGGDEPCVDNQPSQSPTEICDTSCLISNAAPTSDP